MLYTPSTEWKDMSQYSDARAAGQILKQALKEYDAAYHAPHTGSASTQTLKDKERARDTAQRNFDSAYDSYVASERKHDPTRGVEQKSHFTA